MKRSAAYAAVVVLGLSGLSACGGSDDSYCGTLKDYNTSGSSMGNMDMDSKDGQEKALAMFKDLRSEAPTDLQDDYDTVTGTLQKIMDDNLAGADESTFRSAWNEISTHAKEQCDVDMGQM